MENRTQVPRFHLAVTLFILAISLVYSIQNLISPNLLTVSNYFGFGGDKSQLAVMSFAAMLTSGITMVFFGYLSDKLVRVRILFVGTVIFSIASILVFTVGPGVNGFFLFFTLQTIAGVGLGAVIPSTFSLTGDFVSEKDRSKGFSYFSIATLIGTVLGTLLGVIFIDIDWRISYACIGIAGSACAAMTLLLKEPSRIGRDYIYLAGKEGREYSYRIRRSDLKVIFKKKTNIWLIVNFVDTIPTGIILFLLFAYLRQEHNVPESMAIIFLAFVIIGTLLGTFVFGFVADNSYKKGNKKARVRMALFANIAPIPFVFFGLMVPFWLPDGGSIGDLLMIPGAVLMITLVSLGLFLNGGTNGSWYATVVDINLPEHRGTVLASANFFDILGKAIGPLLGGILADNFGNMVGINISIIFWCALPLFWIGVLKNVIPDMEATENLFKERIENLKKS
nr:MFS transporter [Candidatus Sigynarchaeota archaeon]